MKLHDLKIVRFLLGGIWIKIERGWTRASVLMVSKTDGSVFLTYEPDGCHISLHETHASIQAIERY